MNKVFLAHPVTDWTSTSGEYRPRRKELVRDVIRELQDMNFKVRCAAINEDYGATQLEPNEFTRYDVKSILESDIFVLITTERLTRDMYLETGIALGEGIPVFFIVPASARVTYMIHGLVDMGDIVVEEYDSEGNIAGVVRETVENGMEGQSIDSCPLSRR